MSVAPKKRLSKKARGWMALSTAALLYYTAAFLTGYFLADPDNPDRLAMGLVMTLVGILATIFLALVFVIMRVVYKWIDNGD